MQKLIIKEKNDVLIEDTVVRSITEYNPDDPVYLAYGEPLGYGRPGNSWMTNESVKPEEFQIYKEGKYWKAINMVGIQFQIVLLTKNQPGIKYTRWADLVRFRLYKKMENPYIFIGYDSQKRQRTAIYVPK